MRMKINVNTYYGNEVLIVLCLHAQLPLRIEDLSMRVLKRENNPITAIASEK